MSKLLRFVIAGPWLLAALSAFSAQSPLLATCTRSANLLACEDGQGNAYSVMTAGNTVYLRGFEAINQRYWAQTNDRYGQLTFFTGVASNGESWVGYSRRVGWTTINRFASSGGSAGSFICARLSGCRDSSH
ncbi:glutamine synthetase [Pseudomonas citrulli]|uniref:Glutamine synthetase n=1 Tax=Pseudomonas citrulli TaxID=3064347 RepID=A0ABT9C144_9PSED|nr:glutamine synthetase [Pseudomonas sp. K18]MDO7898519.1 glutamine synthetase [Pseudomonas sp. K18]